MNKPKAIENPDNVCFKCLKRFSDNELHKIKIPPLGYGSVFDMFTTEIHLCKNCIKETNPEWWKLEEVFGETREDGSKYKYEDEIIKFVKTFPLEGQELFFNRYAEDYFSIKMQPQDWIDYWLGILPPEKYNEYGLYPPNSINSRVKKL